MELLICQRFETVGCLNSGFVGSFLGGFGVVFGFHVLVVMLVHGYGCF